MAKQTEKTNSVSDDGAPKAPYNKRFLVMVFKPEPMTTVEVYLLPPRAMFEGFGGSRSGLLVGKTPSLVVRAKGPWGWRDVEYELADQNAWGAIRDGIKAAKGEFIL